MGATLLERNRLVDVLQAGAFNRGTVPVKVLLNGQRQRYVTHGGPIRYVAHGECWRGGQFVIIECAETRRGELRIDICRARCAFRMCCGSDGMACSRTAFWMS